MIDFRDLPRAKNYTGQEVCYLQPKFDGVRCLLRKLREGSWDAYTRDGKTDLIDKLEKVPGMRRFMIEAPPASCFDCEVHAGVGTKSATTVHYLAAHPEKLFVSIFAVPIYGHQNKMLKDPRFALNSIRWLTSESVSVVTTTALNEPPDVDHLLEHARADRLEGWVLKREHYDGWYKLKVKRSADLVVCSYTISKSLTHFGKLKAIQLGWVESVVHDSINIGAIVTSVGSGFDQEWRHSVDPETLIGRVAEIEYDSVDNRGRLRFPRFLRWRDDKQPHECTKDQLDE